MSKLDSSILINYGDSDYTLKLNLWILSVNPNEKRKKGNLLLVQYKGKLYAAGII